MEQRAADDMYSDIRKAHMPLMLAAMLAVMTLLMAVPAWASPSFGATDSPAKPVISSAEVSGNFVVLKWKRSKRARTYNVFVQTGKDKIKYLKTVKKTKKNKARYSGNLKYRLKVSGNKYKVYKRINRYKKIASGLKKRRLNWQGSFGSSYRFVVQAVSADHKRMNSRPEKVVIPGNNPAMADTVKDYADRLFKENLVDNTDYTGRQFSWDKNRKWSTNWIYYTGLMMKAYLDTDFDKCREKIVDYYRQQIIKDDDGNTVIRRYAEGELDSVMPATGLADLIVSGTLNDEDMELFSEAVRYVYSQLEKQTVYPEAGNLWLHSQNADGSPRIAWKEWNICLDGVYMSQIFLIHLAGAIDSGKIKIYDSQGDEVTSKKLWDDIYSRLTFVMKNFRDPETGLLYHGYCVETGKNNQGFWSRGMGWYAMVLLEAAEKIPGGERKEDLADIYQKLMRAIVKWQDPDTSLWYNVTDGKEEVAYVPKDPSKETIYNIPESSGSAMFAYCLLRGYHDGILRGPEMREAGLRAFNSLVKNKITDEGLTDIYRSSSVSSTRERYQINGYVSNEAKGVAPLIMASKYAY